MGLEYSVVPYQELDVKVDRLGCPWLSQEQIAEMLGTKAKNVSHILNRGYEKGEIGSDTVVTVRLQATDGKFYNIKHYNLEAILYVGLHSRGDRVFAFNVWITNVVHRYIDDLHHELDDVYKKLNDAHEQLHYV